MRAVILALVTAAFAMQAAARLGRDPSPGLIECAPRRHPRPGADGPGMRPCAHRGQRARVQSIVPSRQVVRAYRRFRARQPLRLLLRGAPLRSRPSVELELQRLVAFEDLREIFQVRKRARRDDGTDALETPEH